MSGRMLAVLAALAALTIAGCSSVRIGHRDPEPAPGPRAGYGPPAHAPAHGYRKKFQYVHYPDSGVYYASDRGQYYWLEAGQWKIGARLPGYVTIDLGNGVTIELDSDTPYAHHKETASRHPGKGKGRGKGLVKVREKGHWKDSDDH